MFDALFALPDELTALLGPALESNKSMPVMERLHWLFLLSALVLAAISWWRFGRRESGGGIKGFFRFVFPREVYFHPSVLVDIKVWATSYLFRQGLFVVRITITAFFAAATLTLLESIGSHHDLLADSPALKFAILTLAFALVSDLATYLVHRASHEMPLLWCFHKLHHSAETMTPITLYRKHPLYDLMATFFRGPMLGVFQAAAVWSVGAHLDFWVFLGANVAYGAFNLLGANLRHTHIWFNWGPALSRIFISPAQHQIHHSLAPHHHNKNYGEVFAIWDWMFGSLYAPKEREILKFGLADEVGAPLPQPHNNLREAWLEPIQSAARVISRRDNKPAPETAASP